MIAQFRHCEVKDHISCPARSLSHRTGRAEGNISAARTSGREDLPPHSYNRAPEDNGKSQSMYVSYISKVSKWETLVCVCTWFSISRVCAADIQKRARASVIGVAGKPTTTTPIFLASISRANALISIKKEKRVKHEAHK